MIDCILAVTITIAKFLLECHCQANAERFDKTADSKGCLAR